MIALRPVRRARAALAALLLAGCAPAADGVFFAGIDDLPLMPGLSERPAERASFDSASGRIEARGAAGAATRAAVLEFYAATLPQLGWQRLAEDVYARGAERLRLDLEPLPEARGEMLLRILITPG
jgi:hypothetical protein